MTEPAFACPKCETGLAIEPGTIDLNANCPSCQSFLVAHFYPAFFRPAKVEAPAAALVDQTEASCFYHPQKQAVRVCDGCGRLICSLCSIDMGAEHLCPSCLSSGKKKGKLATLESSRVRYDSIALSIAVLGFFMSIFSIIMAPMAIYISIRHWNSPRGLMGDGRARFVIAILVATGSLLFWCGIFGLGVFGSHPHRQHHA